MKFRWQLCCILYPGLDERDHGPDGDAGDGGGGEDAAGPLGGGRVGVHRAVILIHRELRHVRHLQDDDELGHGLMKIAAVAIGCLTARKQGLMNFQVTLQ